jgi:hypothetical protein
MLKNFYLKRVRAIEDPSGRQIRKRSTLTPLKERFIRSFLKVTTSGLQGKKYDTDPSISTK